VERILIIDDEPDITEVIDLYARQLGYLSDRLCSGDEVSERIRGSDYWAVFCDLKMPGLNGMEIFDRIRELRPGLCRRFVLMTGAILDRGIEERVAEKGIIVLRKPFNFDAIREMFRMLRGIR